MEKVNKVKITVEESNCRSGYHKKGETFIVDDLCPHMCSELWNNIYPYVFAIRNGASLDSGLNEKTVKFSVKCPDECRVCVVGELIEDEE